MKLHYSQTALYTKNGFKKFYYLMKLHYSQTIAVTVGNGLSVLLPYEITLFSNENVGQWFKDLVLLPYEITLFSNLK